MSEQTNGKIPRSRLRTFLNTGTRTTPVWSLCGDGITDQTISYNPQTEEEQYIHQDTGSTDIVAYRPTIATPMTAFKGDPVFEYVDDIRINRKVLSEASSEVCIVYMYKSDSDGTSYVAERNDCSIQVDDFGGPAGESATLNFTINLKGDPVYGTFNPSTKAFTVGSAP